MEVEVVVLVADSTSERTLTKPRWNAFRSDQLLPAVGAGLRFTLEKKDHINYRVDRAVGRAGHTLTIGIGEAF